MNINEKIDKTVSNFLDQIKNIRVGSVSTALIDIIKVPLHGQNIPIKHLGNTKNTKDGRILIEVYDEANSSKINSSLVDNGFSSYLFSKRQVQINIPPMSLDERKSTVKRIKELAEQAKIAIRNIRRDMRKSFGEDHYDKIEEATKYGIKEIDTAMADKQQELLKGF